MALMRSSVIFVVLIKHSLAFKVVIYLIAAFGDNNGSGSAKGGNWSTNNGSRVIEWFISFLRGLRSTEESCWLTHIFPCDHFCFNKRIQAPYKIANFLSWALKRFSKSAHHVKASTLTKSRVVDEALIALTIAARDKGIIWVLSIFLAQFFATPFIIEVSNFVTLILSLNGSEASKSHYERAHIFFWLF